MTVQKTLEVSIIVLSILFIALVAFMMIPNLDLGDSEILKTLGFNSEVSSPHDIIKENQIYIYNDRIVIMVPNAIMSRYADTNSMDPTLDYGANGIEIPVTNKEQIHVGDIIAYQQTPSSNELIVHRVIEIGIDNEGWYCITKGDNNSVSDGKIRFPQIKYITIAVIW